jgi:hypothetical protein
MEISRMDRCFINIQLSSYPLLDEDAACSYGFVLRRARGEQESYQRLGWLEMWQYGPKAKQRRQPVDFEQFFYGATLRTIEIV